MWVILMIIIGVAAGIGVAGGLFAFTVAIGIVQRMATKSRTNRYIRQYECSIIAGGILGNIAYLFKLMPSFGYIGLIFFGLFSGIYVGVVAMTLAEIIKILPIMLLRLRIDKGIPYIITSIGAGKMIGALYGLW